MLVSCTLRQHKELPEHVPTQEKGPAQIMQLMAIAGYTERKLTFVSVAASSTLGSNRSSEFQPR